MKLFKLNKFSFDGTMCTIELDYYAYDDPRGRLFRKGALDKAIKARSGFIVLWEHDIGRPIGAAHITGAGDDYVSISMTLNGEVQYTKDVVDLLRDLKETHAVEHYLDFGIDYDVRSEKTAWAMSYATDAKILAASLSCSNWPTEDVDTMAKNMGYDHVKDPVYKFRIAKVY
jgi:hypothetical protein